jgi:hypothetical protein
MQDSPSPLRPTGQARVAARQKSRTTGPAQDNRPVHIALAFLCLTGAVIALTLGVKSYAHVSLSAYTQAHGVRENARIDAVSATCPGGGNSSRCSLYTELTVTLPRPVRGHTTSIVNVRQDPHWAKGDTITVLVNPQAPSYSELPGQTFYSPMNFYAAVGGGLGLFAVAMAIFLVPWWRKRRQRRTVGA